MSRHLRVLRASGPRRNHRGCRPTTPTRANGSIGCGKAPFEQLRDWLERDRTVLDRPARLVQGARRATRGQAMIPAIRRARHGHVDVEPAVAFAVFTEEIDLLVAARIAYRVAGRRPGTLVIEPQARRAAVRAVRRRAGRAFTRPGAVTAWEPPAGSRSSGAPSNFAPGEVTQGRGDVHAHREWQRRRSCSCTAGSPRCGPIIRCGTASRPTVHRAARPVVGRPADLAPRARARATSTLRAWALRPPSAIPSRRSPASTRRPASRSARCPTWAPRRCAPRSTRHARRSRLGPAAARDAVPARRASSPRC